jgi:hypothetical protein
VERAIILRVINNLLPSNLSSDEPRARAERYREMAASAGDAFACSALVPLVIDSAAIFRIDSSAMTEMHRDREMDCREEVRGDAQR